MSIADRCCLRILPELRDLGRDVLTEEDVMRDLLYPRDPDEESSEEPAVAEPARPPAAVR